MVSNTRKFCVYSRWPTSRISASEITDTSEVSLAMVMNSLLSAGSAMRSACGITIMRWMPA